MSAPLLRQTPALGALLSERQLAVAIYFGDRFDVAASSCWEWNRGVQGPGYGRCFVNRKQVLAHRLSFLLANGFIPHGLFVLHRCDNPRCINPEHLFVGTHADNMEDMRKKGRLEKRGGYCRYGHDLKLTAYMRPNGARQCRICMTANQRARYRQLRGHTA